MDAVLLFRAGRHSLARFVRRRLDRPSGVVFAIKWLVCVSELLSLRLRSSVVVAISGPNRLDHLREEGEVRRRSDITSKQP